MLFITKKVSYQPLLDFLATKNIRLLDEPMIRFTAETFDCPDSDSYDIVFFSSPRSVEYFLNRCSISEEKLLASIGKSTSERLRQRAVSVHFEGEKSGNPVRISKAFAAFTGDKKVLFPQSSRSNRTIQQGILNEQIVDLIIYRTELAPFVLKRSPSIIVFTSPSNAEAFLRENSVNENQKIIAWGKTTERFLNNTKIDVWKTLERSSFEELTELLENQLN